MNISKLTIFVALMTAFSLILFFIEFMLPKPMPFMKLGLSNIVIIAMIISTLHKEAFIVSILKAVIGGFLSGVIFTPTMLLSFFGSIASCLAMIFVNKYIKALSITGVSVVGSFTHLCVQLLIVRGVVVKTNQVFHLYPLIAFCALSAGIITAIIAKLFLKHINLNKFIK